MGEEPKGYMIVNVEEAKPKNKAGEVMWDGEEFECFVKVEIRGGSQKIKLATSPKLYKNAGSLYWNQELILCDYCQPVFPPRPPFSSAQCIVCPSFALVPIPLVPSPLLGAEQGVSSATSSAAAKPDPQAMPCPMPEDLLLPLLAVIPAKGGAGGGKRAPADSLPEIKAYPICLSFIAACGIYMSDILDAVPIDKYFELFKPGLGGEGGQIRVSMNYSPGSKRPASSASKQASGQSGSRDVSDLAKRHLQAMDEEDEEDDAGPRKPLIIGGAIAGAAVIAGVLIGILKKK
eukprot:CAMPEP_0117661012 /NCGR_PEP_ID=MMETSP0804-20121206/7311_1 /TAXON_ID=1074897 /ORGANISM="Tetraselmis astigmatica, Strain CCMP880" /LENGTH=289 /DNA_ID=CAMNT_0005467853 /DNA_START=214 /DNA_END=1090 /DNA_ORIENTATION=+